MSATKTPWKAGAHLVLDAENGTIADCYRNASDACADAQLIVKAVNSYQPMLEALKNHVETFEPQREDWVVGERGDAAFNRACAVHAAAVAAIALAEGTPEPKAS